MGCLIEDGKVGLVYFLNPKNRQMWLCEFDTKNMGIPWVVPPPRMPVTTRIITFVVGNPYKPSFATVTGRGDNPRYTMNMGTTSCTISLTQRRC